MLEGPVVIGGTGGSGTRIVARVVAAAGRFLGARLNASHDALDLAEFDWRWALPHLLGEAVPEASAAFEEALARHLSGRPAGSGGWGWKHPHSYLLIPFLAARFPDLRFIHVLRDGRAVALSANLKQVRRYGRLAGVAAGDETTEARLRYWSWSNLRAAEDGRMLLGPERYLQVRLEDLCARPEATIRSILDFTGDEYRPDLPTLVSAPGDLDRGRDLSVSADVADALRSFGYPTSGRC